MPNSHPPCPGCRRRHRPGPCEKTPEEDLCRVGGDQSPAGHFGSDNRPGGIHCYSLPGTTVGLARILRDLADLIERFPTTKDGER